jgi:hypothetical protein
MFSAAGQYQTATLNSGYEETTTVNDKIGGTATACSARPDSDSNDGVRLLINCNL